MQADNTAKHKQEVVFREWLFVKINLPELFGLVVRRIDEIVIH